MLEKEIRWLLQEKYQGVRNDAFFSDCARLAQGEPLAYVIGSIPFLNTTIYLDSRPLIPRTETEFWTDRLISHIKTNKSPDQRVLDLCAGSGCIGIAIGHAIANSHLTFCELTPKHKATITKNCLANDLSPERFVVYTGDLFAALPTTQKFNIIVSNPPYIDKSLDRTEASVKNYEPPEALYSNEAGFALLAEIISKAPEHLLSGGELWLEHEPEHVTPLNELASAKFLTHTHVDQYGVPRFSQLVLQY